jgi:hypothetical protein
VQQTICIVLASRSAKNKPEAPAKVRFQSLPAGHRTEKFAALAKLTIGGKAWVDCPTDWRAPFLPASTGAWATYPSLDDFFIYNGSAVQPMRVWVIAPDADSLKKRWQTLVDAKPTEKMALFHPTLRDGEPSDRHIHSVVHYGLAGHQPRAVPLAEETRPCLPPVPYGHRSFDRQWIIPDPRVITQPNVALWESYSDKQVYLTALMAHAPTSGPALTFTGLLPDKHHYKGSFSGRVFPLWRDAAATEPNIRPKLLVFLAQKFGVEVSAEDVVAYIDATAAHPAFTARFQDDLSTPGLRIPLTADRKTFAEAVELGRTIIWLHTFGERMTDAAKGRPAQPPRLPVPTPKHPEGRRDSPGTRRHAGLDQLRRE